MRKVMTGPRKWLLLAAIITSFSGCSGDAGAAETAATSVEPTPTTATTTIPKATVPAPTTTAPEATPSPEPTQAVAIPTPQNVQDPALILQQLTPNVGPLDYPEIGEVQTPFEADMLYTTVEFLNALIAAETDGALLSSIESYVELVEAGRINADLAEQLGTEPLDQLEVSNDSSLRSFWFEYGDDGIDLHLCSHIAAVHGGEMTRVTSDRAFRFNAATDPLEFLGVSVDPVDLEAFVPCPSHPGF